MTYSAVYWPVITIFMATTVTGIGPYSTQFGPYWAASLLAFAGLLLMLRPTEITALTLRPAPLLGVIFFSFLALAAFLTSEGRELKLQWPMVAQLVCFLLALWFAPRLLGTPRFAAAILPAFAIAVGANLFEFFIAPQTWSVSPGRAAGFFVNPNNSGDEVALLTFLILSCWRDMRWPGMVAILLSGLAGVIVTFSRGSIIIFLVLLFLYLAPRMWERRRMRLSLFLAVGSVIAFGVWFFDYLLNSNLSHAANMRLLSLLDLKFSDLSVQTRASGLVHFSILFLEHPFFGAMPFGALAVTNGPGPHNSFIALGADFGVLAMAVPLLMIFLAVRGAKQSGWHGPKAETLVMLAAWMCLSSLFSHNVFYSSYGAVAAGLALGVLGRRSHVRQVTSPNRA